VGSGADLAHLQYDALSRPAAGTLGGELFARWFVGHQWVHQATGMAAAISQRSLHPLTARAFRQADLAGELYIHADASESSLCVTHGAGAVQERHRFGPFGEPQLFEPDGVTPLATTASAVRPVWRAMEHLGATGLYAASVRLYDPRLGEFTGRDPLLFIDSPSPYAFAGHDPADFLDPLGLAKAPLGDAPAKPAPPDDDWTTYTEWTYPAHAGQIPAVTRLDTGNKPLNFVFNKVLLPWRNLLGLGENAVLATLEGIDRELRRSMGPDYYPMQHLLPFSKVMSIGVCAEEVFLALRGASVYLNSVKWRNLALNFLPTTIGGFGGGGLPVFKSATRPGMSYQDLGDTPLIVDAGCGKRWPDGADLVGSVHWATRCGK
jgi:RHS repeat-associated protein